MAKVRNARMLRGGRWGVGGGVVLWCGWLGLVCWWGGVGFLWVLFLCGVVWCFVFWGCRFFVGGLGFVLGFGFVCFVCRGVVGGGGFLFGFFFLFVFEVFLFVFWVGWGGGFMGCFCWTPTHPIDIQTTYGNHRHNITPQKSKAPPPTPPTPRTPFFLFCWGVFCIFFCVGCLCEDRGGRNKKGRPSTKHLPPRRLKFKSNTPHYHWRG